MAQDLKTVFENEFFVVVDKPGSVLSVPSQWGKEDPRPVLSMILTEKYGQIWPVHRLDFEVTGLVLFAKDAQSHRIANNWFESRDISKAYEAWSEGSKPEGAQPGQLYEWSSLLHRGKKRTFVTPHGKLAVTRAHWIGSFEDKFGPYQRWQLDPITGRPHQLRVELSQHGFPILGDKLYGAKTEFVKDCIALRAVYLDFSKCSQAEKMGLPKTIEASQLKELVAAAPDL